MMALLSSNNSAAFPSEQVQLLQDIARDGNADEYDYGSQANTFEELDPASLLESLANFEHPPPSGGPPTTHDPQVSSERHFESLLQAAASADSQETAQASRGQNRSPAKQPTTAGQFGVSHGRTTAARANRKRGRPPIEYEDEDEADDNFGFIVTNTTRRKRKAQPDDPEQLAIEHEIWGPDEFEGFEDGQELEGRIVPLAKADPRAAGVHSAAALFRRPSAASKKYTRPPMSKLFTSLELHPEQFLHLQAAAKRFMLDENYPERSDSVGNKGREDTDMTKLKLFGCVKSFLEDEGWGEKCFGVKAPEAATRKLQWPLMKNKIISLITPLLRRMVTNERQRLYALETRKTKPQISKSNKRLRHTAPSPSPSSVIAPSLSSVIDPKLDNYHYDIEETFSSGNIQQSPTIETQNNNVPGNAVSTDPIVDISKKYLINIMKNDRRIEPEITIYSCPHLSNLIEHVRTVLDGDDLLVKKVKIWGPRGLIRIRNEDAWKQETAAIMDTEWINGEIKCIVDVDDV